MFTLRLLVQKSSSGVSGSARSAWEEEETAPADWGSGWNDNNDNNWNDDGKVKDNNYKDLTWYYHYRYLFNSMATVAAATVAILCSFVKETVYQN